MLYVISDFSSDLTAYIFSTVSSEHVRLIDYKTKPTSQCKAIAKVIEVKLPSLRLDWYFSSALLAQLNAIGPDDYVLIFAMGNLKDTTILRKYLRKNQTRVFLWNPVHEHTTPAAQAKELQRLAGLQALSARVYTFDHHDAAQFQLGFAPQPFSHGLNTGSQAMAAPPEDIDFYFLGVDKGRLPFLLRLHALASQLGLRCFFYVIPDKDKTYSPEAQPFLHSQYMDYAQNLDYVKRAKCLLEVVQPTQTGATMRTVEALFLNKKLITTRQCSTQESSYDPSRTCLVDDEVSLDTLRDFMARPMVPPSEGQINAHEINHWLAQFCQPLPTSQGRTPHPA